MSGKGAMKAYRLSVKDDDDAGQAIVFAKTAQEARKLVYGTEIGYAAEEWIWVKAHRDKRYDGMENLSPAELAKHQWRDGWRWFDMDYPDPDEATDAEFVDWYNREFGFSLKEVAK